MGGGIADRALARRGRSADPVRAPHLRRRTLPHGDGLRRRIARLLHDARPLPRRELGPGARDGGALSRPAARAGQPALAVPLDAGRRGAHPTGPLGCGSPGGRRRGRPCGRGFDPRDRVRRLELRRGRDRRATRRGRHAEVGAMPPIPTGSPPPRWRSTSRFLREARRTSSSPYRFRRRDVRNAGILRRRPRPPPPAIGGQSSRASSSPFRPRPSRSRGRPARTSPGS